MNDLISVIIPAYNIQEELGKCLDSVLAQTHENLEIIVVNDGSRDNTGKVLDRYAAADKRIKAIHKPNGGVSSARLCGIENAAGEWIGFVDGDDFVEADMFEVLYGNAMAYGADISHCGYKMVFPDGHIDYYYNTGAKEEFDNLQGVTELISGARIEPALWNKLYRKELIRDFIRKGKMDYTVRINEDVLMNYYLFSLAQKSVYEDKCLYHYVLRKGSAATSSVNEYKLKDPIKVTKRILEDAEDERVKNVTKARLVRQLISAATMSADGNRQLIVPYRKEIRRELRGRIKDVLVGSYCSNKLKIMALWTAVWPASYGFVHTVYEKLTGLDEKYKVD